VITAGAGEPEAVVACAAPPPDPVSVAWLASVEPHAARSEAPSAPADNVKKERRENPRCFMVFSLSPGIVESDDNRP